MSFFSVKGSICKCIWLLLLTRFGTFNLHRQRFAHTLPTQILTLICNDCNVFRDKKLSDYWQIWSRRRHQFSRNRPTHGKTNFILYDIISLIASQLLETERCTKRMYTWRFSYRSAYLMDHSEGQLFTKIQPSSHLMNSDLRQRNTRGKTFTIITMTGLLKTICKLIFSNIILSLKWPLHWEGSAED